MPTTIILTPEILRGEADASFGPAMSLGRGAGQSGNRDGRQPMLLETKNAVID
jgi:hypothetical protein